MTSPRLKWINLESKKVAHDEITKTEKMAAFWSDFLIDENKNKIFFNFRWNQQDPKASSELQKKGFIQARAFSAPDEPQKQYVGKNNII